MGEYQHHHPKERFQTKQGGCSWQKENLNFFVALAFLLSLILASASLANPEGGIVAAGNVTIASPDQNTTTITQTSEKGIINWDKFNIAPNEKTIFNQPNANAITLNRINPHNGASAIHGQLNANGQVWLINPAGILFGPTAQVNVASLIATTANITDDDFLAGRYNFFQSPEWNGAIINEGTITVADKGLVALVAPGVVNSGVIQAKMGTVVLAAGKQFTLDFYGDQLIQFGVNGLVDKPAEDANGKKLKHGVENSGRIIAEGGKVLLTAHMAESVVDHAINMSGYVEAKSAVQKNGEIILLGGNEGSVKVTGTMVASGREAGQRGGKIKVLGKKVHVDETAKLDVAGDQGGGEILIGGNFQGKGPEQNAKETYVGKSTTFIADALTQGDGGKIIIWSDDKTYAYGNFSARGGVVGGDGGLVETSGHNYLDVNGIGKIDLRATNGTTGTWLIDPSDVVISNDSTSNTGYSSGTYSTTGIATLTSTLNAGELGTQLANANVVVLTTGCILCLGNGDITVNNVTNLDTNWTSGANTSLTLRSSRDIIINTPITLSGTGKSLILDASTSGRNVSINSALNGSFALTASAAVGTGTVTIGAALGGNTALSNVSITGLTNLNANVTTTGAQTYNSATTLGSNVTLTGGTITMPAILLGSNLLTISTSANDSAITGIISGAGSLSKTGSGTLTLQGLNTYAGNTTINGGILKISADINLGLAPIVATTDKLIFGGGTLQTTASFILNANRGITLNAGGGTLSTDNGTLLTYGGIIAENSANSLTKRGTGDLLLSGLNTYTGGTNINEGALRLGLSNSLSTNGIVTLADVSTAIFDLNNHNQTLAGLSGGGTTGGNVTLGSGTLTVNNAGANNYSGIISGTGNFIKSGAGTLTLGNANTYQGTTTINAGTLRLGSGGSLSASTAMTLADVGTAIFDLNNNNQTLAGLSGGGTTGGNVTLGSGTLTVNNGGANNYSGIISGTGNFIKSGAGTLTLGNANTYQGTTTINAGTLRLGSGGSLSANTAMTLADVGTAVFDLNNNNQTLAGLSGGGTTGGNVTLGSGTLTVNNASANNYSGIISGTGNFIKSGVGTLTLGNANTYQGTTTINAGTLRLGSGGSLSANTAMTLADVGSAIFDLNNNNQTLAGLSGGGTTGGNVTLGSGTLTVNNAGASSYSGIISGTGNFIKSGVGTLTLGNANTYQGTTTINAGTLRLDSGGSLSASTAMTLADVGTAVFDLNNNNQTLAGLSGGGTTGGNVTLGSGTLTVNNASANSYSGIISGTGNFIKSGAGTLTLGNANTYQGTTTINAGTLRLGSGGSLSASTAMTLADVGTAIFDLNNNNQTLAGLSGGGTTGGNVTLGSGTLTVNNAGANNYSGIISGTGGLTKTNLGTLTLTNTNTFFGSTAVASGILNLTQASALSNSIITIANGGTLQLSFNSGTFTNNITLNGSGVSSLGALYITGNNIALNNAISLGSSATITGTGSSITQLGSGITGSGFDLTITLGNSGVTLPAITLNSGNLTATTGGTININGNILANNILLNSGSSADVILNTNLGSVTPINIFQITNARNFTNNATLNVNSFSQLAGTGISDFGTSTLNANNGVTVTTNQANGRINAASLSLSVASGNLQGSIAGFTGSAAARQIVLLTPVSAGALFYNGVDLGLSQSNTTVTLIPASTSITTLLSPSNVSVQSETINFFPSILIGSTLFATAPIIEEPLSLTPGYFGINPKLYYGNNIALLLEELDHTSKKCSLLGANIKICNYSESTTHR